MYDKVNTQMVAIEVAPPMEMAERVDAAPPIEQTVEVVAPADLQPGYQFTAEVEGESVIVVVPSGGVKQGERFLAGVVESGDLGGPAAHKIPTGGWRDEFCDCCVLGCCHVVCCLSYWMKCIALGQLQTRMKLDSCGNPVRAGAKWTAFKTWFIIWFSCFAGIPVLYAIMIVGTKEVRDPYGQVVSEDMALGAKFAWFMVRMIFSVTPLYFLIAMIKTRLHIRRKYSIPETCCVSMEDCCCSYWCACCTVSQMLRHTADHRTYAASCCDSDGLVPTAPKPVE